MPSASICELSEEGGDGWSHIGARIIAACFWRGGGGGGSGNGRARRRCDGLMPGLGRPEHVQQSLYAICVLEEEEGEGTTPGVARRTYVHVTVRDKLRAVARNGRVGGGDAPIAWLRPGPVSNTLAPHVSAASGRQVPHPACSRGPSVLRPSARALQASL